jgi:hypothetical protein
MYIQRTGGKPIRARRLDRNDGAARLAAPGQGLDPKLRNESCRQASPSRVPDAFGPHDGIEHTSESNRFRWRSFSATMWSRRSRLQLPTHLSATPFCQGDRKEVRLGMILVAFTAPITSSPNF